MLPCSVQAAPSRRRSAQHVQLSKQVHVIERWIDRVLVSCVRKVLQVSVP